MYADGDDYDKDDPFEVQQRSLSFVSSDVPFSSSLSSSSSQLVQNCLLSARNLEQLLWKIDDHLSHWIHQNLQILPQCFPDSISPLSQSKRSSLIKLPNQASAFTISSGPLFLLQCRRQWTPGQLSLLKSHVTIELQKIYVKKCLEKNEPIKKIGYYELLSFIDEIDWSVIIDRAFPSILIDCSVESAFRQNHDIRFPNLPLPDEQLEFLKRIIDPDIQSNWDDVTELFNNRFPNQKRLKSFLFQQYIQRLAPVQNLKPNFDPAIKFLSKFPEAHLAALSIPNIHANYSKSLLERISFQKRKELESNITWTRSEKIRLLIAYGMYKNLDSNDVIFKKMIERKRHVSSFPIHLLCAQHLKGRSKNGVAQILKKI
ncbi:hypothetical protein RCL1_002925 [Eukaryota sp. TZLM3-RCL]